MILATTKSKNGVLIRLTDERWGHIINMHEEISIRDINEVLNVVKNPSAILEGDVGEVLATSKSGKNRWLVVAYKEEGDDGFIITAYVTTDFRWLFKKKIIWTRE